MSSNKGKSNTLSAFFYPQQSVNTSSKSPSEQINNAVQDSESKNNSIINLTQGKINMVTEKFANLEKNKQDLMSFYDITELGLGRTLNVPKRLPPGQIPGPSYNGAVTTGERCVGGHCSIPIDPNYKGIISSLKANAPRGFVYQLPATYRPGNSSDKLPGLQNYEGTVNNPGPFAFQVQIDEFTDYAKY
jgi:hypothetical protein